jgi:hypothetical protein
MKRATCRRAHGIGLVELLLALAVAAIVLAPLAGLLRTSAAASGVAADRVALERDADFALERIAARVRASTPALLAPQPASSSSGNWFSVTFQFSGSTLTESGSGTTRVLAENVSAFSITAPTVLTGQQLVQASLTLTRGDASTTHSATVRMGGLR